MAPRHHNGRLAFDGARRAAAAGRLARVCPVRVRVSDAHPGIMPSSAALGTKAGASPPLSVRPRGVSGNEPSDQTPAFER